MFDEFRTFATFSGCKNVPQRELGQRLSELVVESFFLGGALNPLCPTIFRLPCDWEAVPHKAPALHTDTYALRGRPVGHHSPMIGVLHTRNLYDEEACGVGRLTSSLTVVHCRVLMG